MGFELYKVLSGLKSAGTICDGAGWLWLFFNVGTINGLKLLEHCINEPAPARLILSSWRGGIEGSFFYDAEP